MRISQSLFESPPPDVHALPVLRLSLRRRRRFPGSDRGLSNFTALFNAYEPFNLIVFLYLSADAAFYDLRPVLGSALCVSISSINRPFRPVSFHCVSAPSIRERNLDERSI
jgi:hypothetical protein